MPIAILGVSGSLQAKSGNRALLDEAARANPDAARVTTFDGLRALPQFDPDLEARGETPDAVRAWREALRAHDAVLVATPEYGFSMPGSLKNAVDWVIGTGELERKVVAITAAVPVAGRGARGLRALRDTLDAVSARVVGGASIARGPAFEHDVATLVKEIVAEVARARAADPNEGRPLRPTELARVWAASRGLTAVATFEDRDVAIVEWTDASGAHGCSVLFTGAGLVYQERSYMAPATPEAGRAS